MANIAFMKIEGSKQGGISRGATTGDSLGNSWQEGHEDECMVYTLRTETSVPCDPNSGMPTGARRHAPTVFVKPLDKATPLLWQAISTGETLNTMELKFWRVSPTGAQENYFTIKWTDAVLVKGSIIIPDPHNAVADRSGDLEEWSFVYRKVEWTHRKAGTEGADDWRAPTS